MKVSEFAKRAGVAASAIRFYEREGVLPPASRSGAGYRQYDDTDLNRVRVLTTLRSLGLDLQEAGRLASMCSEGRCDEMTADLLPRIAERRAEIAKARSELDHLDAELVNLTRTLHSGEPQPVLGFERWNADVRDHPTHAQAGR